MTSAADSPAAAPPAFTAEAATLEQFLAGIATRALRFAEGGLRHREDARDAVQDAMTRMLGYRDRPAAEWTPLFWSVLRSRIVDAQRRGLLRLRWLSPPTDAEETVDWADPGGDPSQRQEDRQAWARIVDALRRLPQRQREAFTLRIFEDLDVATTARVMGCSEGAVKTHLSRARDALQRYLEDFR
ncbi:RNA polymerase sigma factor [Lysobacter solisilvae (ex Woo and Kim 2020)]|uniref:RNA polymerase sigma factor n=1 Tax=Agrilutibacter terrestris TaxID=2865112 RepID=A0A7H0FV01_9GAMM|nr:RNA polymerase sigma factor [Lysobacter terrestris]QNP39867.1 RNA polymerase sigma factor [Lysobacter terrestris]